MHGFVAGTDGIAVVVEEVFTLGWIRRPIRRHVGLTRTPQPQGYDVYPGSGGSTTLLTCQLNPKTSPGFDEPAKQ